MLLWQTDTRYYAVAVRRDLFGGIEVLAWWGGRGSRLGSMRASPVDDWRQALAVVRAIARRRRHHGYILIRPICYP